MVGGEGVTPELIGEVTVATGPVIVKVDEAEDGEPVPDL